MRNINKNDQSPYLENINRDASSLYLTSTQNINNFNPNVDNQYGDNSYSDTADLPSNVIPGDFNNSGTSAETAIPEIPVAINQ